MGGPPKEKRAQTAEEKATKKATKQELSALASARNPVLALLDDFVEHKTVWGHNCNASQGVDAGMRAARARMEANALLFSGGSADSPRFTTLRNKALKFDLVTIQSQLPVVDMKKKASKFFLELFRASGSQQTPTNFRELLRSIVAKMPADKLKDMSDVVLYQYYNLLRGGFMARDASKSITGLPSCMEAVTLTDAAAHLPDKAALLDYVRKVGSPLMVPRGFETRGIKSILPLLEYERAAYDYADGEAIF